MKEIFNKDISVSKVPIWFMRQAGRYLPEYNNIRKNFSDFIEFCYTPTAVCEVTLQPIKRFGFDASIIFSDILVILDALGCDVKFQKNHGPRIIFEEPQNLKFTDNFKDKLNKVYEGIKLTKKALGDVPLYGFAGAPWTLACYLIEGGGSKDYSNTRIFAYKNPEIFKNIINILTKSVIIHLKEQIKSGVDIVQIFDSWAGIIPPNEIRKWVINPTIEIIKEIKKEHPNIPIVAFPKGIGIMYKEYEKTVKPDGISLDYYVDSPEIYGDMNAVIQGNLDPCILFASQEIIKREVNKILENFRNKRHIFNLGHGILPTTPIENVEYVIDIVRNFKK